MTRNRNRLNDAFVKLCNIEPRLWDLYREARSQKATPEYCANYAWYRRGGLKGRLCELAGWEASHPNRWLHTPEAYDIAYQTIYNALPDCKHTGACGG